MPPMSSVSERDRLSKELKLAHQERLRATAKSNNAESLLFAHCRVYKTLGLSSCTGDFAAEKRGEIMRKFEEFEKTVEELDEAQKRVLDLEDQLLNQ